MPSLLSSFGRTIRGIRPGIEAAACNKLGGATLRLASPAFADGGALPIRFTADGEQRSPPLEWSGLPPGTRSLALLVEDVDAPFPRPLVHLVLHGMPPTMAMLLESAVPLRQTEPDPFFEAGRNSFMRRGWLPPSPIPGHGVHRYVFQLYALRAVPGFSRWPGRGALVRAIAPLVLAQGQLVGTYERP